MNFLSDIIPAKARKVVYAIVGLLSLLAAIPDLFPESWNAKLVAILAALSSAMAVGNVAPKDEPGGDPPQDRGFVRNNTLVTVLIWVGIIVGLILIIKYVDINVR